MATVNKALRQYLGSCTGVGKQSSLSGFISKNEDICLDFIEQFNTADNAQKNLTRRYSTLHKNILARKGECGSVRWIRLYEKAKAREDLRIAAMRGIRMTIPLALEEMRPSGASTGDDTEFDFGEQDKGDEDHEVDAGDEGNEGVSDAEEDDCGYDTGVISRHVLLCWTRYVARSTAIARRKGLSIINDIQRLLSVSNVMLLKPRQHDPALSKAMGEGRLAQLHNGLRNRFLDKSIKVEDKLFLAIKDIVEDIIEHKGKEARLAAKRRIMRLDFDIADMPIIEVVCNCISCLPSFPTDSAVGEFELITSYLDPVLRPLLHDPDEMRLLRWTNRVCTELSNDFSRRPDGTLTLREQFHGASALGFCEVKPADSGQNAELCFTDLLRLALFSKSGIDKGEIQGMMVVHAIGPAVTFYVMELAGPGLYPLVELATITMPLTIDDLSPFLMRLSLLKQVHVAYHRHSKHLDQKARSKFDKWRKSSMTAEELQDVINITASKDKAPNIHV